MTQPTSILLVDDDPRNLTVLESILEAPEHRLVKAVSAEAALMALLQEEFAVIVMDVLMPDMSGLELAQLIKGRRKTQHIPILFLTAHYQEDEHVVSGYDAGAVDYITKPVNPAILRSKIGVFVDLFRKTTALSQLNAAMEVEIQDRLRAEAALLASNEELARKNAELERAAEDRVRRQEAEAANRAKDRFLAMLSHELRTPLSPVLHAVALIEESEQCSPEARELLETIRRNVELEARLIDDLLDVARIRSGKLQLHLETVNAHDLIRQAVQICGPDVLQRSLTLQLHLNAERSHLRADSARIQQIFWNLINNSVKYTSAGGVVTLTSSNDAENRMLQVEVRDSGIGIDSAQLGRIFDAFEQVHGDRSHGLGLGLAISRVLAESHGGVITARSAGPGKGSCFTVAFPLTAPAPAPDAEADPPARSPEAALRILLVEDHFDTAVNLKRLLLRRGYTVRTAASIREAREAMRQAEFDVLVSDIGLPDGQGVQLMEPFLASAGARPVAGIAVSGYGMNDDVERSREAGFLHHLTKPVKITELQNRLTGIALQLDSFRERQQPQP